MDNINEEELREDEQWRTVLAAYAEQQAVQKAMQADDDGWISRLPTVKNVPKTDLPKIHGKLIAYGYLKFQLAGRTEGVKYQISSLGRETLNADGRQELLPSNVTESRPTEAA